MKSTHSTIYHWYGPGKKKGNLYRGEMDQEQLGKLVARGRVHGQKELRELGGVRLVQSVNPHQRIDGARLETFHPHNKSITIQVDESSVPEFWLQIDLPLAQLLAWVELMQKEEEEEGGEENTDIKEEEAMDI
jgi:hypothetical protein